VALVLTRMYRWTPRRIKILRAHFGETQPAFAARLGVALATLRDYEQGRRKLPANICRLLDCLMRLAEQGQIDPNPDPRYRKKNGPMPGAEERTREEE
jgi:DNA-binding transcriptional regulator YiaG